jgi:hypothetical protein
MPMQLVCQASLTQSSWQLLAHSQSTLWMILNCIQNLETLLNANFVRKNLANKLAKQATDTRRFWQQFLTFLLGCQVVSLTIQPLGQ